MERLFSMLNRVAPEFAGLVTLATALGAFVLNPVPLQRIELQVIDWLQGTQPWTSEDESQVVIVDIDEQSIARLGQWPWPRTDLANLTRKLGQAGASVVAYDIVFSEADRTSPEAIAMRFEDSAMANELVQLPSHDTLFSESFGEVPVVTAYFFVAADQEGRDVEPKASFTISGTLPRRHLATYSGALVPLPTIEQASAGTGFVTLQGDVDGIVRRVPLVAIQDDTLVSGLALESVRVARGAGSPNLLASDGTGETLSSPGAAVAVRLDGIHIPVNDAGEMWIHFPRDVQRETLPAWKILSGEMSGTELAASVSDKVVFVGGSAEGLQDLVSTPVTESVAGVSVHATAAEQILSGHFLERPDWAGVLEGLLLVVLGLCVLLLLPRLGAAFGALAALGFIAAVIAVSWIAYSEARYLLNPTWPVIAIAAVYSVQTVAVFYREERRRSYIHSAFDRYLSPELVRQITSNPDKLELGGEERDMSVLMVDVRGFSRISEQLTPREVIDFLTTFLTPMSDILLKNKATIDKYIGDAILAFWNAPLDDADHPANAARAALEMIEKAKLLNAEMDKQNNAVWPGNVKIGIGLNAGVCCVGNMGSEERLSYTLIGDTVNIASRLEGLTKQYGVPIAVGENLIARLDGFALIELDRVRVVGRDRPETISALLGDERVAQTGKFEELYEAHSAMLHAYRARDWDCAEAILDEHITSYETFEIAGLHALFIQRIADLRADPPGADWDGVFQATSK